MPRAAASTELVLAPRVERALVALAVHAQQIEGRLEQARAPRRRVAEAGLDAPTHDDLLEVRLHSAKVAAELARVSVELRAEIDDASCRRHEPLARGTAARAPSPRRVLDMSDRMDKLPPDERRRRRPRAPPRCRLSASGRDTSTESATVEAATPRPRRLVGAWSSSAPWRGCLAAPACWTRLCASADLGPGSSARSPRRRAASASAKAWAARSSRLATSAVGAGVARRGRARRPRRSPLCVGWPTPNSSRQRLSSVSPIDRPLAVDDDRPCAARAAGCASAST